MTLHVGLNLVYLVPGETGGMETYARELIPAMVDAGRDVRFTAFLSEEAAAADGPWQELPCVRVPVRARHRAQWVWGEQRHLPGLAERAGVDVLHSLANTAPVRGGFRRVVTINDLIYRIYPEAHSGMRSVGMRVLVPQAARRSHRIIAPSKCTLRDIVRYLGVSEEKVDVVPDGVRVTRDANAVAEKDLRARHQIGSRPILLSASAKRPHKNLLRLLDAMALIVPANRPVLVLPGYPTPYEKELRAHAAAVGVAGDTCFLGWIEPAELEGFYRAATGFVFPSLYEGFGLPVLEAMARGVPVACSDRSSLPEVAGHAALFFDPEQPQAIAEAIERLMWDASERERLRRAGLGRLAAFTWAATASSTIDSYERANI